jgi:hypothetical protein
MQDTIEKLAMDVKRDVIKTCAKVAEIHFKTGTGYFTEGYNEAVRDIAAKIRRLADAS